MISPELAESYRLSGLSALPASKADKTPCVPAWGRYRERLPTKNETAAWFANGHDAVCIVCGAVSGNLECIDFDHGGELYPAWAEKVRPDLLGRLAIETTQSGGRHVVYRCEEPVEGNAKLATGVRDGKQVSLIETRGEGGLVLCSPSEGYGLVQGDFTSLPVLKACERRELLDAARSLDERTVREEGAGRRTAPGDELRPGDDYCVRGDIGEVLTRHGWTLAGQSAGNQLWRRPGKDEGHSATYNGEVFHVFSTNAEPFEAERGYSRFQVYAILEHGGDWEAAARELRRMGYGAGTSGNVDLAGIMSHVTAAGADEPEQDDKPEIPDPGPVTAEMLHAPGFVTDLAEYSLATSNRPNPTVAYAGALAVLALLTGRVYASERGTRTNIYIVALAGSGMGKERPRQVNYGLLASIGAGGLAVDAFASGEGIEDMLSVQPNLLLQTDEFSNIIDAMRSRDKIMAGINTKLLSLVTASGGIHVTRIRARQRVDGHLDSGGGQVIVHPNLNIFATAVPDRFYTALATESFQSGLVGRCMIIDSGEFTRLRKPAALGMPADVKRAAESFWDANRSGGLLASAAPPTATLRETPEASEFLEAAASEADDLAEKYMGAHMGEASALWMRAFERCCKLAMLHALSRYADRRIGLEDAEWGKRLSWHVTGRMLAMGSRYACVTKFDENANRALRIIEEAGVVSHSRLLRLMHLDRDELRLVVETLRERGQIAMLTQAPNGRAGIYYSMAGG